MNDIFKQQLQSAFESLPLKIPSPDDGKLEIPTELTEDLLAEYARVKDQLTILEATQKAMRDQIVHLTRGESGAIRKGGYIVTVKPRKGIARIDWERFVEDQIGPEALEEILSARKLVGDGKASPSDYVSLGTPSVQIDVKQLKGD